MTLDCKMTLDEISLHLLQELQANARLSFAELGRRVGLSLPAVSERVRRLEEMGVITGYRAAISPTTLGYTLTAFVRLSTTPQSYPRLIQALEALPEVLECHHVTGRESFVLKVIAPSISELEALIGQLSSYGPTETAIVMSSPVTRDVFVQSYHP
ncbi:MAG: Lrp/AsnC family transcriptional regulator [Cyanobacteria bacterium P01_F01_bin.33]